MTLSLRANDAGTAHDPRTGQFTAGSGASPSTKGEHKQQSSWHKNQAESHFNQMHQHRARGNLAGERESRSKWSEHKKAAEHHEIKSREEMVPTGGREGSIPRSKVNRVTRGLLHWSQDCALQGENPMTAKLSPRGMLLKGGIYTYIAPRLAQDAKIDIDAILLGAPTTNRITQRAAIVSALRTAASGKLAQDADLDDVAEVLEAIEHLHEEEEGDDMEPNSAMPIVQREAGEDDMPPEAHEFLKSKLHPDDHARLMELMHAEAEDWDDEDAMDARRARRADDARRRLGRDESEEERREREDREGGEDRKRADDARRARDTKRADDAKRRLGRDETPEECAERMRGEEAADRKRAADRKHARDAKRADDARRADDRKRADDARRADDKRAMDAAIATERSNQRAIREAERNVRPYIGELPATLAADSADEVYRHALTALGVKTDGVHPSAYRTILELQPRTGARSAAPRLAADAAGQKSFAERYPQAARISHI